MSGWSTAATTAIAAMSLVGWVPAQGRAATTSAEVRFVCAGEGSGRSVVDVLEATGDHDAFLDLTRRFDSDGFAILADPELADKTVWAPTDAAFGAVGGELTSRSEAEIKAVLGYHISPPRRSPTGAYPIVSPQFLADARRMTHRTRTGVLAASEQRTQSSFVDGVLRIEDARVLETAWCT